ncbi:MAG: 5-(carboxyamino)imidazole ribonucleotide synthase [Chloroflexaceae bacterium]|nr:5-(carboxyamino)imidazole ribonucleotide synthase [Chloroflexaceae bacterium]
MIGIIGGGQLGRMLALAGYPLGLTFRILDPKPNAPASYLADHVAGSYDDHDALSRFARDLTIITYEFENIPIESVRLLAQTCPVYPPPDALATAQDRLLEKQFFQKLGIPTSTFAPINHRADLDTALARFGLPAVLKTRRMGYDGKGQITLRTPGDIPHAWERLGQHPLILESLVPFERELSVLAVRGHDRTTRFYPLIENTHRDGILHRSQAPAPHLSPDLQQEAETYAHRVLDALNYVGVLAIELFQFGTTLLANEMAPRVHNSGHWTIEGAETSQFANHLRAITGLPLGSTAPLGTAEMLNIIGTLPDPAEVLSRPDAHLHLYGKPPRPGRKLGHITYCTRSTSTP